jgi:hypothetical protein
MTKEKQQEQDTLRTHLVKRNETRGTSGGTKSPMHNVDGVDLERALLNPRKDDRACNKIIKWTTVTAKTKSDRTARRTGYRERSDKRPARPRRRGKNSVSYNMYMYIQGSPREHRQTPALKISTANHPKQ